MESRALLVSELLSSVLVMPGLLPVEPLLLVSNLYLAAVGHHCSHGLWLHGGVGDHGGVGCVVSCVITN